ncbi:hypothetical protein LXA43DRAFT_882924 [Ganoderma leucocontextum]|nr:hypothetical protein LXA43DRAFT_882924 [Ganoderma leucocontextum]
MSAGPHPFHAPFPIEIEEHIIDQLVDHFASIRNCSLTCRAWVPRSRFHLFGAVQITTGSALDAVLDYFQTNPHMRPLVRSLATAPTPTERTRLLGTYPASLIRMLPNLRRWEMRAPLVDAKNHPPKVFFHRTTLIQLRCSPITELHVSSIHFPSQGEFVRLISSIPLLRVLQCSDVHFGTTNGIPFNNASPLRRRPKGLSTLQVSE